MKLSRIKVSESVDAQIQSLLLQVISDVRTPQEADALLSDLLTETEKLAIAKRLAIATSLVRGRSYAEIKNALQVSSATIAKIQESLDSPGMKLALSKAATDEWAEKWASKLSSAVNKLMGNKS